MTDAFKINIIYAVAKKSIAIYENVLKMIIDISKKDNQVGESFDISFSEELTNFEYGGTTYAFAEPVNFDGIYLVEEHGVGVIGKLSAVIRTNCSRCLKDTTVSLNINFNEAFRRETDEEDAYSFKGYQVDIDKAVMDNITLNMPLYVYCDPDCKGLCPHCGKNLNEGSCNCEIDNRKTSGPFSQLNGMFSEEEKK